MILTQRKAAYNQEILKFFDCANINFSKYQYLSIGTIKILIHKIFLEAFCFTEYFKILIAITFISRSSHRRCSVEKGIFKNCANFTGKYLCWWLKACNFIKKRLQHSYFPGKFTKHLRTPFLKNICERLLLSLKIPSVSCMGIH